MKIRYFKYVEIEKVILQDFLSRHPKLASFVSLNTPFNVRVSRKPFAGLIHTILSQDQNSESLQKQWEQIHTLVKKVSARKMINLTVEQLIPIVGNDKAKLIWKTSSDVYNKILNLKELAKQKEEVVVDRLCRYENLSINSIHTFLIFCLFKQNVLAEHDEDFIKGLKIFLNKQNITKQDIDNIKIEYRDQLTLFSLCMWKINNERSGK